MTLRPLLAVALLAPALSAAAPDARPRNVQSRSATATRPAPADAGPRPAAAAEPSQPLELDLLAGYEADHAAGPALRLDGAVPLRALGARVALSFVGSIGYSRLTDRLGFLDLSADVLKLVPALRFTLPLGRLAVFGDAGIGFAYVRARLASGSAAFPLATQTSTLNVMARVGVGAWYRAGERLSLGAMAELDPILGDFGYTGAPSQRTTVVLAGALLRL